jgi:hypothetical protein
MSISYTWFISNAPTEANLQIARAIDARAFELVFDRAVNQTEAETIANYSLSPTLKVIKSERVTDFMYRLTTARQVDDTIYTVTVVNVRSK